MWRRQLYYHSFQFFSILWLTLWAIIHPFLPLAEPFLLPLADPLGDFLPPFLLAEAGLSPPGGLVAPPLSIKAMASNLSCSACKILCLKASFLPVMSALALSTSSWNAKKTDEMVENQRSGNNNHLQDISLTFSMFLSRYFLEVPKLVLTRQKLKKLMTLQNFKCLTRVNGASKLHHHVKIRIFAAFQITGTQRSHFSCSSRTLPRSDHDIVV